MAQLLKGKCYDKQRLFDQAIEQYSKALKNNLDQN
jgi:tetratricopeptide (TPR) repeat protein